MPETPRNPQRATFLSDESVPDAMSDVQLLDVWGIDVGLRRTHLVAVHTQPPHKEVASFSAFVTDASRDLATTLHLKYLDLCARLPFWLKATQPLAVCVERPSGTHTNLELVAAYGVTIAALRAELPGIAIWTVHSAEWKKWFTGAGNAKKERVQIVARTLGYKQADDEDFADAFGIAVGSARQIQTRE